VWGGKRARAEAAASLTNNAPRPASSMIQPAVWGWVWCEGEGEGVVRARVFLFGGFVFSRAPSSPPPPPSSHSIPQSHTLTQGQQDGRPQQAVADGGQRGPLVVVARHGVREGCLVGVRLWGRACAGRERNEKVSGRQARVGLGGAGARGRSSPQTAGAGSRRKPPTPSTSGGGPGLRARRTLERVGRGEGGVPGAGFFSLRAGGRVVVVRPAPANLLALFSVSFSVSSPRLSRLSSLFCSLYTPPSPLSPLSPTQPPCSPPAPPPPAGRASAGQWPARPR
jgi:hypothetical protein